MTPHPELKGLSTKAIRKVYKARWRLKKLRAETRLAIDAAVLQSNRLKAQAHDWAMRQ